MRSAPLFALAGFAALAMIVPAQAARRVIYNPYTGQYQVQGNNRNTNNRFNRARNPNVNRRNPNQNNRQPRNGVVKGTSKASDVDLQTEVQALKDRHPTLAAALPQELKRMDTQAGPLLDRMPLLVQDSYYRTIEDYKSLSPDDQSKLSGTLRSMLSVPETSRDAFVNQTAKEFGPIQADVAQRKAALDHAHQTFFRVKDQVDKLPAGK